MRPILYAMFATCAVVHAATPPDSKLEGTFTVAGKDIPLKHVLVVDFDDAEGMGDGPEVRVLFSAQKVAPAELESPVLFNLDGMARAGKLEGVLLRFDPKAEDREVHGTTYVATDNPQASMPFFTLGGDAGGVDSLKLEEGTLGGHVESSAEGDADFGLPAYSFSVTFTAPVAKSAPVSVLTGKEAMESAPMKAYLQFEAALGQGDLDAVRKMTTPERVQQMDAFITQVGKEQFLAMVKQMAPDPATREKNLAGVYIRGNLATIVINEQGGKTSMTLNKNGDSWIVN